MVEKNGSIEIDAICAMYSSVFSEPPTSLAGTSSSGSVSARTPDGTGSGARCW